MAKIDTPAARKRLAVRREPHWHQLRKGGYLGYRRTDTGGTWLARWRSPAGRQEYRALGALDDHDDALRFNVAARLASEWFEACARPDAPTRRLTVEAACDHYLAHVIAEKGERTAADPRMRIKAHIAPKLASAYVDELTTAQIKKWRDAFVPKDAEPEAQKRARDTANRNLTTLKAILNRAWKDGLVTDSRAWSRVQGFKDVGASRKVLLDDAQLERLLKHAEGPMLDMVKGLLLTGMRPGVEIEHLTREQFHDDGALEIRESKTGPRTVYLSAEARAFFKSLSKGKTPRAPLFAQEGGRRWHNKEATKAFSELKTEAKLPAGTVLYSLRHTYISRALEGGANVKLIADNCGTSFRMIERHYWKSIEKHRQAALDGVSILPRASSSHV